MEYLDRGVASQNEPAPQGFVNITGTSPLFLALAGSPCSTTPRCRSSATRRR